MPQLATDEVTLEAILTYGKGEQDFMKITASANISEAEVMIRIGAAIQANPIHSMYDLPKGKEAADYIRKISLCQMNTTYDQMLPWLAGGGKYYFNQEEN